MFCPKCGNEIKEATKFCPRCGKELVNQQEYGTDYNIGIWGRPHFR